MGCGASAPVKVDGDKQPRQEEDDEKLEKKLQMARVREWAKSLDPVPWEDINDAARRLGVRGAPKPQYHSTTTHLKASSLSHGDKDKRRGSRRSELLNAKANDSPMSPDGDTSTHISDGEIRRAGESSADVRPNGPGSMDGFSKGRPALSTKGWDDGEPSVGASEEKDRFGSLGKQTLENGTLRKALKRLHESIMGKPSIQHAFYDFDKNHDNQISLDEFLEQCNTLKTKLPQSQLSEVFKAMDANADGFISRDEFLKAFEPQVGLPMHPTADDMIEAARRKKKEGKEKRGLLVKAKTMDLQHKMVGKNGNNTS